MKLDNQLVGILSALEFEGPNARIAQILDRKTYVKVNAILEACGGKWLKRAKAHVFANELASETIDQVILAGEVLTYKERRDELGFFPTPAPLARCLVEMAQVEKRHLVLEPSAGTGRIVEAIEQLGARVLCVERDEGMRRALLARKRSRCTVIANDDFMNYRPRYPKFDRVVMNPPFIRSGRGDHLDHVQGAFGMLKSDGILVSVLPASVSFRQDRRHREFMHWVADHGGEIESLPENSFAESGTNVRTCVLVQCKDGKLS